MKGLEKMSVVFQDKFANTPKNTTGESWQQTSTSCKPFSRARKIKNPTQLMQLIMLYCGQDLSLRSCAGQFTHAHGALSDMGVKKD